MHTSRIVIVYLLCCVSSQNVEAVEMLSRHPSCTWSGDPNVMAMSMLMKDIRSTVQDDKPALQEPPDDEHADYVNQAPD